MKNVLIIGSGIAGMSTAISLAERGIRSILVSPFPSERSQSVMAGPFLWKIWFDYTPAGEKLF